ncbi:MAG: DUF1592 domain-containing protein, partial [Proteobacteria bacterium]|nr:DUF1592 domain-containing protein [Pseudomonadota bacterium]
ESFIRRYGSQVWRRPLSELELQSLMQLYSVGSNIDTSYGMQTMLRGLLSSPNFLYRKEIGQVGALDAYEIASGLSYFFWGSTPDQSLSQAAQSGQLLDPNILLEQAQRLLLDSKAKEGSKSLADAWLNSNAVLSVNKDSQRYPGFTSQLRLLLAKETEDFFDYALRYKKSGFEELFTANYSLGDQALARFSGENLSGSSCSAKS